MLDIRAIGRRGGGGGGLGAREGGRESVNGVFLSRVE